MKKLLAILLAFCFISWNSASTNPEKAPAFNPLYYRMHHMTPLFVLMARPETSSNVGVSFNTEVWTSEQIDATTFKCSGIRSYPVRIPDSAYQTDMYGKKVVVHFDQIVNEYKYEFWSDHIIGSGSGSFNVSSQAGLPHGDRYVVVAGTYTGFGFTNVHGLSLIPQSVGHTVFFTNECAWRSNDSCELAFMSFIGISGNAIDARAYTNTFTAGNGPIAHSYLHNLYFSGVTGPCIDANGGLHYIPGGDTTTAEWLDVVLDSITEDQCASLVQGSFGSPTDNAGQPPAVWVRPSFTRLLSTGTTAITNRGTEARGIMFELIAKDIIMIDTSGLGNSGDCGIFYGHGSGTADRIVKIGPGPGYLWRMSPTREIGRPGIDWFYDCFKFNTTDYGMWQVQNPDSIANHFGALDEIWVTHNTAGRMMSDNNYWCQLFVMGDLRSSGATTVTMKVHIKNNFAFEVTDWANGGAGHDNGTWTQRILFNMGTAANIPATDSSNNQYWPTLAAAGMDTTHFTTLNGYKIPQIIPKSTSAGQIVNGGVADGITTADYNNVIWASPIPIGYLNLAGSAPPPCNPCTVFPGFKYTKKHS